MFVYENFTKPSKEYDIQDFVSPDHSDGVQTSH